VFQLARVVGPDCGCGKCVRWAGSAGGEARPCRRRRCTQVLPVEDGYLPILRLAFLIAGGVTVIGAAIAAGTMPRSRAS
jgi:hypothetical protein